MKLLKLVVVCLFTIVSTTCSIGQTQDTQAGFLNCSEEPELSNVEILNDNEVSYTWRYTGNVSFRVLEYQSRYGCFTFEASDGLYAPVITTTESDACPPDVWTEVPGPLFLKTASTNSPTFKNSSDGSIALFKPCVYFEFRMKVVCESDTLYSNVVPYYYSTEECPDCIPAMNILENHEIDTTFQAAFNINSSAIVEANVTYMAGQRIKLNSGFSSKPGYGFKVMTEDCQSP